MLYFQKNRVWNEEKTKKITFNCRKEKIEKEKFHPPVQINESLFGSFPSPLGKRKIPSLRSKTTKKEEYDWD